VPEEQDRDAKTEEPTARRREEAREGGQVAKSQDLVAAFVVGTGLLFFKVYGFTMIKDLWTLMGNIIMHMSGPMPEGPAIVGMLFDALTRTAFLLLPFLVLIALIGAAANVMQVGFIFSSKPITPDINKINPVNGFKRIFSLRSLNTLLMSLFKVAVILLLVGTRIWDEFHRTGWLTGLPPVGILVYLGGVIFDIGLRVVIALIVLALFDHLFQRRQHEKDLMMTRQELKEEMKRMEGDPHIRARRRAIQRQLAMQRMMRDVPEAEVVITNPTHIAVAIKYDSDEMTAPLVVAKGARLIAEKIKQIAREHGVPVVENPPLARALYKKVEVGKEIPYEFYQAVAEVLGYVYSQAGKTAGV